MSLEQKVVTKLIRKGKTVAIAESCTGGLVSNRITDIPGASECLKYSVIAYSNASKTKFLGVKESVLKRYGAVSKSVSIAMAKGVRRRLSCDIGIGITGIAGPTGGSKHKPVGLTYISINTKNETVCLKFHFVGPRKKIKKDASTAALTLLLKSIP